MRVREIVCKNESTRDRGCGYECENENTCEIESERVRE